MGLRTPVELAASRLATALEELSIRWQKSPYLVGDRISVAILPLPPAQSSSFDSQYRQEYPWLFELSKSINFVENRCRQDFRSGEAEDN